MKKLSGERVVFSKEQGKEDENLLFWGRVLMFT